MDSTNSDEKHTAQKTRLHTSIANYSILYSQSSYYAVIKIEEYLGFVLKTSRHTDLECWRFLLDDQTALLVRDARKAVDAVFVVRHLRWKISNSFATPLSLHTVDTQQCFPTKRQTTLVEVKTQDTLPTVKDETVIPQSKTGNKSSKIINLIKYSKREFRKVIY